MRRNAREPVGTPEEFYAQALTEAERLRLPRARQVEGLDEEIALLRVRLLRLVEEQPQSFDLLLKGVALLVRAVATRYRLSPKAQEDLAGSIAGVLEGIGTALGLGEHHGAA
ncbi:MAG: hypothetical protein HY686_00465 [Chloroflexi bacterium]|nr:hypothetical protein [Chloroflexota bacterium]